MSFSVSLQWRRTASADERDSAKSFSAALSVIWILLSHSAPQICHSTLQWMPLCYLCMSLGAGVCVCVRGLWEERQVHSTILSHTCRSESLLGFLDPFILRRTRVENEQNISYAAGSQGISRRSTHAFPFLTWSDPLLLPSLSLHTSLPPQSECVSERQWADRMRQRHILEAGCMKALDWVTLQHFLPQ